jgi:hypothetical protein
VGVAVLRPGNILLVRKAGFLEIKAQQRQWNIPKTDTAGKRFSFVVLKPCNLTKEVLIVKPSCFSPG